MQACVQAHLGLLLLLCKCSIKGLAGGRAFIEGEAGRIWDCQGRIGGLDGHSMPHLHWLCLQQCFDAEITQGVQGKSYLALLPESDSP